MSKKFDIGPNLKDMIETILLFGTIIICVLSC